MKRMLLLLTLGSLATTSFARNPYADYTPAQVVREASELLTKNGQLELVDRWKDQEDVYKATKMLEMVIIFETATQAPAIKYELRLLAQDLQRFIDIPTYTRGNFNESLPEDTETDDEEMDEDEDDFDEEQLSAYYQLCMLLMASDLSIEIA